MTSQSHQARAQELENAQVALPMQGAWSVLKCHELWGEGSPHRQPLLRGSSESGFWRIMKDTCDRLYGIAATVTAGNPVIQLCGLGHTTPIGAVFWGDCSELRARWKWEGGITASWSWTRAFVKPWHRNTA